MAEVVASHLVEAYELDPGAPEAAGLAERARVALIGAGDRAASLGAGAEAQRYFERAAELSGTALEQAALVERAGRMAWLAGRPTETRALYERAEAAFREEGANRAAARVAARLGEVDFAEGHPQRAIERLRPAAAELRSGEGDADSALVAAEFGRYLALVGDDGALEQNEYALALAEKLDLPETLAHALINKAIWMLRDDRLFEARALLEAAAELALSRDFHVAALRAYNNLGVVLEASDRFSECEGLIARAVALARRIGDRVLGDRASWAARSLGSCCSAAGTRHLRAPPRPRRSRRQRSPTRCCSRSCPCTACAGRSTARGRRSNARHQASRRRSRRSAAARLPRRGSGSRRAATPTRSPRPSARSAPSASSARPPCCSRSRSRRRSRAALALGDTGNAAQLLAELEPLRPGELTPLLRAEQARFRARLLAATGSGEPEPEFAAAERLFRELELQPLLATTLVEHAESLLAGGHGGAEPLLTEAGEIFGRLEATPWLERIATAEGARPAEAVA